MKTTLSLPGLALLLLTSVYTSPSPTGTHPAAKQGSQQPPRPLATEAFSLSEDMEVGLEIEGRSPGASWGREGAEAAALLVFVDGVYNQDLLLWAGDEMFRYRVMLGRLARGRHTVSVALNAARSAAGARRAEVKSLRPLPLAAAGGADEDRLALARSPFLYARANAIDRFTDLPLLMYYETLREAGGDLLVDSRPGAGTTVHLVFARADAPAGMLAPA